MYQLYINLDIGNTLSNASYRRRKTAKLRTIIDIIKQKVGAEVKVNFVEDKVSFLLVFYDMTYCSTNLYKIY